MEKERRTGRERDKDGREGEERGRRGEKREREREINRGNVLCKITVWCEDISKET